MDYDTKGVYMHMARTRKQTEGELKQTGKDFKTYLDNKFDTDFKTLLDNWSHEYPPELIMLDMVRVMAAKLGCFAGNALFPIEPSTAKRSQLMRALLVEVMKTYDKTEQGHIDNGDTNKPLNMCKNYRIAKK